MTFNRMFQVTNVMLFALLCAGMLNATTKRKSDFYGWIVAMSQRKLNANGEIGAKKEVSIRCSKLFSGKGSLIAPEVTIVAKKFDFRGTIDCSGMCMITTQEPFDETIFTKQGDGKFVINVDPSLRFPEDEWTFKGMVKTFAVCAACAGAAVAYDHYYGKNYTRNWWRYLNY